MHRPPIIILLAAVVLILMIAGCATLPQDFDRPESYAIYTVISERDVVVVI